MSSELNTISSDNNNEFKKPDSNSSIIIKPIEKKQVDLKEMIKLDNFDFMTKLSNEINKKKTDAQAKQREEIENKAANVSIVSSVESFQQFNKKLAQRTHQTSSPLPKVPNFFEELKFIKKNEYEHKSEATSNLTTTKTTITKNNKYATSFDFFSGMSNINESLNILHKKIGAPTISTKTSVPQQLPVKSNFMQEETFLTKNVLNEVRIRTRREKRF